MAASPTKSALEDLLRNRHLRPEGPPLQGEDRRLRALATGCAEIDRLLEGGFPRGEVSQIFGPASSGRAALALAMTSEVTREGALVAWVDPADELHPASAMAAGVVLERFFWLRGRAGQALPRVLAATATLLGSGLFDLVVLDLVSVSEREQRLLPGTTWVRLRRLIEGTPTALLLIGDTSRPRSPGGLSLQLEAPQPELSGRPPAGRILTSLHGHASLPWGRAHHASFSRRAFS